MPTNFLNNVTNVVHHNELYIQHKINDIKKLIIANGKPDIFLINAAQQLEKLRSDSCGLFNPPPHPQQAALALAMCAKIFPQDIQKLREMSNQSGIHRQFDHCLAKLNHRGMSRL